MKRAAMALCLLLSAPTVHAQVQAQGWGNLDALLFGNLTNSGTAVRSYWLPDAPTPDAARQALGVVYEYIPGSAGNTGIALGLFVRQGNGWVFDRPLSGVFGQEPRDVAFGAGYADLTTTMPGPNDPRCCPTQPTRWRIDFATRTGRQLQ